MSLQISSTLQLRLNDGDKVRFAKLHNWLKKRSPVNATPCASDVLRAALYIATSSVLEDGGTLGVWHCPECSAGNGEVKIDT